MKAHYRPGQQPKHDPGKHATPWHKQVAEAGTILRCEVGSGVHGTSVSGYDDRDEMGICIEPPDAVIGFRNFEQYEWHTAWEREGGRRNRSGYGDLDEVVYSLRKWMRLAANGNPSVLVPLFAPDDKVVKITLPGHVLRGHVINAVLSRTAGKRFMGYLAAQRHGMLSHEGKGRDVTRPELIEKFGFDTKFAGHMIRLGYQGLELMETGRITLPMPPAQRQLVMDIRRGRYQMKFCLDMAEELEHDIEQAMETSPLPEHPDYDAINAWMIDVYREHWENNEIDWRTEL